MREHLARNWGNWASVAGLVFSLLAFVFSKRASNAAEEARDSVLRRSLGQDMSDANRIAADIVRFVSIDRGDMALLRADDLMNDVGYLSARWKDHLPAESRAKLLRAREQLHSINFVLTRQSIAALSTTEKARLLKSCLQVMLIFSEGHGDAARAEDNRV
jgi:hypothetical protein